VREDSDSEEQSFLREYLSSFERIIGDKRTAETFGEVVKGVIASGSLICERIAAHSPVLSEAKDGAQRVIRLATGESTIRSQIDAENLTARARERSVSQLAEQEHSELWLIPDGSDLRKQHAKAMPALMKVRDLGGKLVPGYRTLNVLAVTPGYRGLLYHRLFSSTEDGFISEPHETQRALRTVSDAIEPLKNRMSVTWIMDRGFDDIAVFDAIWSQGEHFLCRVSHTERIVECKDECGRWRECMIAHIKEEFRDLAVVQTKMVVRLKGQARAKQQTVTGIVRACEVRLSYRPNARSGNRGEKTSKTLWLVHVELPDTDLEPMLLLTDWPVVDHESALKIFRMYRQRWSVEDSFKFIKDVLGWEDIQLLDMAGVRTLAALGWIAAGFLYELGITLDWPEVQLLAKLGGWTPHKNRKPGKITLTRGLARVLDMLATQATLEAYVAQHGHLPPMIAALVGRDTL
jgi:hypothetical protein